MKNKTTAAILAFFLGCFGVQWFYLGKAGKGIAYLLIFWVLFITVVAPIIIGILCFVEFIQFLTMSEDEFNSKYNIGVAAPVYQSYSQPQPSSPQMPSASDVSSTSSKTESLLKLKSLLDSGVLTQEEFDAQKRKILNNN